MKYCRFCGGALDDKAEMCVHCGRRLEAPVSPKLMAQDDESSLGFALVGFLIPFVGVILYAVFCSDSPKKARSALNGAIVGFIVSVVASIIMSILSAIFDLIFWNSIFGMFEEILYEFF